MNICFTISSLHCGGSERVISTLANNFVKSGHQVSIILVSTCDKTSFYELEKEVNVVALLKNEKRTSYLKRVVDLRRAFKKLKPDVVVAFLPHICIYSYYALRGLRIPLICSERNDPNKYSPKRIKALRKVFSKASGCVFQTNDARKFYGEVKDDRCTIIPNPVYLLPEAINIKPKEEKLFVSVGRLEKQKRFDLLINAFAKFCKKKSDYKLEIYGSGSLKGELTELINNLDINSSVQLIDNNPKWHMEVKKATAFVSSSDFEGMPNCLEEALCLGCQCIATDCSIGGSRDLIDLLDAGLLIKPNCEEELISAFEKADNHKIKINHDGFDILSDKRISSLWIDFMKRVSKQ